jgi:hypothetical protein
MSHAPKAASEIDAPLSGEIEEAKRIRGGWCIALRASLEATTVSRRKQSSALGRLTLKEKSVSRSLRTSVTTQNDGHPNSRISPRWV